MGKIEKYDEWEKRILESSTPEQLNELFGLGKLLKSFFKSVSEPVRKNIDDISKNIDDKTGKVKDSKALANELVKTFAQIANDKKADLKGIDDVETLKTILKEFITDVRSVFVASRVPFTAMVAESEQVNEETLNEDLKADFQMVMTKTTPEEFDSYLDTFLDDWIIKNGKDDLKALEKNATRFISNMMDSFSKKVKAFGPERLDKLVKLSTENPAPKKEEVAQILDAEPDTTLKPGEEIVETPEGKAQFIKAIEDLGDDAEIHKMKNKDGSYDVLVKDVKLK